MCSTTCSRRPRGTNASSQKQTQALLSHEDPQLDSQIVGPNGGWVWGWTFRPPWGTPGVCLLAASASHVEEFAASRFSNTESAKVSKSTQLKLRLHYSLKNIFVSAFCPHQDGLFDTLLSGYIQKHFISLLFECFFENEDTCCISWFLCLCTSLLLNHDWLKDLFRLMWYSTVINWNSSQFVSFYPKDL